MIRKHKNLQQKKEKEEDNEKEWEREQTYDETLRANTNNVAKYLRASKNVPGIWFSKNKIRSSTAYTVKPII